jgi:hypothetical protein
LVGLKDMKIHRNIAQGSDAWLKLRVGKVTASEMTKLVSDTGKIRTGDGPSTFLNEKLAEILLGEPLPKSGFFQSDHGHWLEESARPAFTLETGLEVEEVGFIETDDGRCGASPDGIIVGKECGLEIKCPMLQTAIGYLLGGVIPDAYILQVQASLFVTGWPEWKFMSFRRGLPPLIITVEPDAKIQAAIAEAVEAFTERIDLALAKLKDLNGGVLPTPPTHKPEQPIGF